MKFDTRTRWLTWVSLVAMASPIARADNRTLTPESKGEPVETSSATSSAARQADSQAAHNGPAAPSAEQIGAWVADLDDNRYLVREAATRRLLESGDTSLKPLLATANGERPEPADRAVWIMRRLASGKDLVLRRHALEQLVLLQNRPQVSAAARETLAEIRHDEAVEAIQRLGGRYITSDFGMEIGPYLTPRVVLDQQWRGGNAGLEHLRHLVGVRQVIIIGTNISAEGLAHLREVNLLRDLLLYGTDLEADEVPEIQKLLPQVAIDFRLGGLLGVGSNTPDGMGPALVGLVSKGSVAEAAGIQVGDIIQKFENQPVPNFKALTLMIGKHRAGEEVTLEVLRSGQPIVFKLKLGAWETIN